MATQLKTFSVSFLGLLHTILVVFGFVLWEQIADNDEIKNVALLIATLGIFFPTLSLLNVNLFALSNLDIQQSPQYLQKKLL